jgi:hypothetical protein
MEQMNLHDDNEIKDLLHSGNVRVVRNEQFQITGLLVADKVIGAFDKQGISSTELTLESAKHVTVDFPAPAKWRVTHYIDINEFKLREGNKFDSLLADKPAFQVLQQNALVFKLNAPIEFPTQYDELNDTDWFGGKTEGNYKGRA